MTVNPMTILYAVLTLGVLGGGFGAILAVASKIFAVEKDPRIEEIQGILPGANCGGCGFGRVQCLRRVHCLRRRAGERLPGVFRGADHRHRRHHGRGGGPGRAPGGLCPVQWRHPVQ